MAKNFSILFLLCGLCKLAVHVLTASDRNQAIAPGDAFFQVFFLHSEAALQRCSYKKVF